MTKAPPTGTGVNYRGGPIKYRRLQWNGQSAGWVDGSWQELGEPTPTHRNYFDLDNGNKYAPQSGETASISLGATGSRLCMAVIRGGKLWTCQHVGLDGTDKDYDGDETGSSVDRSGIQWYQLQVNGSGTPLTYVTHDRFADTTASSPYYYYMPSLMVNSAGDMVAGFSGSKASERIGALFSGRRADASVPLKPILLQAGRDFCNPSGFGRWGDYSYTTLDPTDGSLWTVQEYAEVRDGINSVWGTWISSIKPWP